MTNLDIIKTFDSEEMAKFLASVAIMQINWTNWREVKAWLETESKDDKLRRDNMIWINSEWIFDKDSNRYSDNWVLSHMPDILEFILTQGNIRSNNVLVVIPTIESGHKFDDYKDIIHYKGVNFTIWSDFFDYNEQEHIHSSYEGEKNYKQYLSSYYIVNFMKNYGELVSTIKIYYKNK